MSVAELNDLLRKVSDHDDDCPYEDGSVKSLEWLKKPYVQKEYKKYKKLLTNEQNNCII